jgi:hypothetical protein
MDETLIERDKPKFPFPARGYYDGRYAVFFWYENERKWLNDSSSYDLAEAIEMFEHAKQQSRVDHEHKYSVGAYRTLCLVDMDTKAWIRLPVEFDFVKG